MRISDWSSDVCSSDLIATIDRFRAAIFRKNANRHADGRRFQTLQHVEEWRRHRENAGVIGIVRLDTLADRDDARAVRLHAGDVVRVDPRMPEAAVDTKAQPLPRPRVRPAPVARARKALGAGKRG